MIYKNWSFRMFIYTIILNIAVTILLANKIAPLGNQINPTFDRNILIFSIASFVTLILGSIFIILSILKKEPKDYKSYISIFGFIILILFAIFNFLNKQL